MKKFVVFSVLFLTAVLTNRFAFAVVAPRLSVIQSGGDSRIIFGFDTDTPFVEKTDGGRYRIAFQTGADSPDLSKILPALSPDLRKMKFSSDGKTLTLIVDLPTGTYARARKKGTEVALILSNKKVEPEKQAAQPSTPVVKAESEKAPVASDSKIVPEQTKPSVPAVSPFAPYSSAANSLSMTLSAPGSFADGNTVKDSLQSKRRRLADSGYRSASLSFPWTRMTAVAAFRRDGYLWLVFDRKGEFDFSMERELYKDIILEMVQIPHSQATIFRMVTAKGYNPSLRREGLLWVVDLMYQPLRPRQTANLLLQRKTPFGPRIFIPLDEAPQVLPLIDPEVGDLMYIIPLFSLSKGLPNLRTFVDATFLPSAQGLVIVPNIEELNVYSSTSGVEVRGPKETGMRFSSEDILNFLTRSTISKDPLTQILDVSVWATNEPAGYLTDLKRLQQAVIDAPKDKKDLGRLILARYYFANGMYPETLSILKVITDDNPSMSSLPGIVALRGAVNFMMMRYDEAMPDLANPLLKQDAAVEYWRAATLVATSRNPEKYLQPMKDNMAILQSYPQPIKTRLALAGLHAAVAASDEFSIQNFMEAAYNSQNTAAENAEITFYHALWQESTGMYSLAQGEMATLAQGTDFYFRAMGGLEKVRMDTRAKAITPQERIEELERLSYAWRGGEFEYNLMTMLVAAYQDQKNYAEVMHILKDMQIRFKGSEESKKIKQLMDNIFLKIFLNENEADLLPPVKAIALYNEFIDLTPPGEKGAQIVRHLADRLVSIDLLDSAGMLLENQLRQPIGAKERGLISTRLALVRLLNKEPEKALKALQISENGNFSDKVKEQRLLIKAKALADMKKTEEAAALLQDNPSDSAKMLRAEIFWQAQQWGQAADALKLLIKKPEPGRPLTSDEAQRVLDWAAALRLAGRAKVVIRLRENFLPLMKKTDLAEAFDFITRSPQQGLMDYRSVTKEVESAESFRSFAKNYSNLIKTKGLSGAVQ